jgi:aryl-alcohol dehydrogenase-like predicted oxidoreductase
MEYRAFGETGLQVSVLGFGCWEMGGGYGDVEEQALTAAVQTAIDRGINIFDTAPAYGYGRSEQLLGRALGARRKDVYIVTKCGIGIEGRPSVRDSSRETILQQLEKSLRDLNTDYVDVYLIHWPDRSRPFEEAFRVMDDIVQAGKARFVGVSNFKLEELQACERVRRVDVVQYGLNLFDRRMEQSIFPYCHSRNIGVMVYGPLAYGMLTGTLTDRSQLKENDWRSRSVMPQLMLRLFSEENFPRNLAIVRDLQALARQHGKTLPQFALAWVLAHPGVHTVLMGTRAPHEIEENLGAVGWAPDAATNAAIDEIFARHGVSAYPEFWLE